MNTSEPLIEQVRQLIVEKLAVRMPAASIHARTPLFAGGLELNSFAVVELIGLLEQRFQFQFQESDFREESFRDLQSLAELIYRTRPTEPTPLASQSS
ncbi:MAG: acyl carrier protein [Planctomycetaceae bacterium]|nr:acyl carrier protein [Planctomycetaceae bacterium]